MNNEELRPLLSPRAYTSEAAFRVEKEEIFGRNWIYVGMEKDLVEPGDTMCSSFGPHHLLLVRDDGGNLCAYHNLCRHRGTRLLTARGKKRKMLVCPYHRWTYSLDGALRGVPDKEQFPGLDMSNLSLHPASVTSWKGLLFAHPDPDPVPFEAWLGQISAEFGPEGADTLPEQGLESEEYVVRANWKIFIGNAIEGYHLRHLHADTLNMYDHTKQKSSFVGRHWTFSEPPTESFRQALATTPQSWLLVDPKGPDVGNRVHLIFPNLLITESESDWSILVVVPEAKDRTKLLLRTFGPKVEGISGKMRRWFWTGDSNDHKDSADPLKSGDFMLEDLLVCERQHEAMSSPRFSVGPLAASMECDLVTFQQRILDHLDTTEEHQK